MTENNVFWLLLFEALYILVLVLVCLRIIYDTDSNIKTLAYLLLVIFVPVFGIFFYFFFGVNYRHRKMYSKKLFQDEQLRQKFLREVREYSRRIFEQGSPELQSSKRLARMLLRDIRSPLTGGNQVKLLINGEEKFPEVLRAIRAAKKHIHVEYYIIENDETGGAIGQALAEKAREGVDVRVIYDDLGSRPIRKKMVPALRSAGVKIYPFHRIIFSQLANRINYRNHRKIIVVDGHIAFVGGINISDRYHNGIKAPKKIYWRDTHLRIEGPGALFLQYLFLCDWNFCAGDNLQPNEQFFPDPSSYPQRGKEVVQIAAGGPDSDFKTVLFSMLEAIDQSTEEILITTPYFIPGESLAHALTMTALGGVSVKLLVPGESDSRIVNAAARSYYLDMLAAGVEIYLYRKGFIHAKTLVSDRKLAVVGTANMDYRSFDLNFEVNATVYSKSVAEELRRVFYEDLEDAEKIDPKAWARRPKFQQLMEKVARLVSQLL